MKTVLKLTSVVGIVMGAAILLGTSPAEADTFYPSGEKGDESLTSVRQDVAPYGQKYALTMPDDMPQTICYALANGVTEQKIITMAVNAGLPRHVADAVVYSSEWHFCPNQY